MTSAETPLDNSYPFDLEDPPAYTGALANAAAMIYSNARTYARLGLVGADFDVPDWDKEFHLNNELAGLREHLENLAATLAEPGPWQQFDPHDDVPLQVAELHALVGYLQVPLGAVEDAISRAMHSARRRHHPRQADQHEQWQEFDEQSNEAIRDASGHHLPADLRLAALDRLIAHAHLQRARILREQAHSAYIDSQTPRIPGPAKEARNARP